MAAKSMEQMAVEYCTKRWPHLPKSVLKTIERHNPKALLIEKATLGSWDDLKAGNGRSGYQISAVTDFNTEGNNHGRMFTVHITNLIKDLHFSDFAIFDFLEYYGRVYSLPVINQVRA